MNYFDKDIDKMEFLKRVKYCTLALTIFSALATTFFTTFALTMSGENYPITKGQKQELVAIAKEDEDYQQAYEKLSLQYKEELTAGTITQQQYNDKMEYLESHEFINRVVDSAKTQALNDKVEKTRKFIEFSGKGALGGVVLTAGSAGAYIAARQKRERIKRRWYSEEEGKGI